MSLSIKLHVQRYYDDNIIIFPSSSRYKLCKRFRIGFQIDFCLCSLRVHLYNHLRCFLPLVPTHSRLEDWNLYSSAMVYAYIVVQWYTRMRKIYKATVGIINISGL